MGKFPPPCGTTTPIGKTAKRGTNGREKNHESENTRHHLRADFLSSAPTASSSSLVSHHRLRQPRTTSCVPFQFRLKTDTMGGSQTTWSLVDNLN
eukprot:14964592-Ditylum_brightwellii.AAC.1